MRILFYTISVILAAAFQTTIFADFNIMGIRPILLLVFPIIVTVKRGLIEGCVVAVACGLIMDILGTQTVGINALIFIQLCFVCGLVADGFFIDKSFVIMLFVFTANLLYSLIYFVLMFLIWGNGAIFTGYMSKGIIECIYTTIIALPVYWAFNRINRRIADREEAL